MSSDKTIFSKRYGESEFFESAKQASTHDAPIITQLFDDGFVREFDHSGDDPLASIGLTEPVRIRRRVSVAADINRVRGSKRFIAAAKAFSQKHKVSADIKKGKSCIDAWFYFSTEILFAERKEDLIELIKTCDELMIIPRPRGMPEWCDYAIVLTYMTHRIIVEKE